MDITIRKLSFTYQKGTPFEQPVLHDIDLFIPSGMWVAVCGQTGSGKSTLIQHINGLLQPSQGSVQVGELTLRATGRKTPPSLHRKVGMVFQYPEHQLFAETVAEDIAYGPQNVGLGKRETERRVRKALQQVDLEDRVLDRSPYELSGGQKRRVAIAGVLAMEPQILILDEPTAGLDPYGKTKMLNMFAEWHKQKKRTIIHVTHHMGDVAEYAQKVVVLREGRVQYDVDPLTLFTKHGPQLQRMGLDLPRWFHLMSEVDDGSIVPGLNSAKKDAVLYRIAQSIRPSADIGKSRIIKATEKGNRGRGKESPT